MYGLAVVGLTKAGIKQLCSHEAKHVRAIARPLRTFAGNPERPGPIRQWSYESQPRWRAARLWNLRSSQAGFGSGHLWRSPTREPSESGTLGYHSAQPLTALLHELNAPIPFLGGWMAKFSSLMQHYAFVSMAIQEDIALQGI